MDIYPKVDTYGHNSTVANILDVCGMKVFLIIENMIIIYVILLLYYVQGRYIYIIADHIFHYSFNLKNYCQKNLITSFIIILMSDHLSNFLIIRRANLQN